MVMVMCQCNEDEPCGALVLRGVRLLRGAVALHLDPLAVVEGLAGRGLLRRLLKTCGAATAVGGGADGDLSDTESRGWGVLTPCDYIKASHDSLPQLTSLLGH